MEPGRHSKMFVNKGSKLHMPDPHQDTIEKENEIEFNEFMSSSNNRASIQASFNQDMINNLQNKIFLITIY